ncbi:MAG: methyltransferase domain-containing protein [Pseudomonadota bacterium]|nr:methyltransferase domain-containing protein [Pseudomonadota bacterium]
MEKFVPPAANRALLVGVVNEDECKLLESKGYAVTKGDLMPRNPSIMKLDLTAPPQELHGQFHLVVASDVLEHIPDDRAAVRGIYDLLADGGVAYLHTPGGDANAPLDDEDRRHGHARHGYNEHQVKSVIRSAPFADSQYYKTFNQMERRAVHLSVTGKNDEAMVLMEQSPYDGTEGFCHMFLLRKGT